MLHWIPSRTLALKIALCYALLGALWIFYSGWLLHYLVKDAAVVQLLENVKGWFFVGFTALMLGLALDRYFKRIQQTAQQLQDSEARLHLVGDNLPDSYIFQYMHEADSTPRFTYVSAGVERVHGVTAAEILRDSSQLLAQIDPGQRALQAAAEMESARNLIDFGMELRAQRPDGQTRIIHVRSKPRLTPEGKVLWDGLCQDITDRKQAEEAHNIKSAQLSNAVEIGHLGHWEYNIANDLFMFNDQFYKIFRTTAEQVGGYMMSSAEYAHRFVHPDDMKMVGEETRKAIETTDPHFNRQVEHRVLYADGTVGYITVRFFIVKDSHGTTVKTYGVNQDITERKKAEEEKRNMEERLQRAEKMEALGQLAGGVAHDLNNVLGILSGYSELLLEEIPDGHRSRVHVEKILQSTEKGAAIIQDLLTLARRSVVVSEVINLNSVVTGFLKTPVFEKIKDYHPRVTFRTECDEMLLNIKGSPVHLEKTLMNLVSNAAESISGMGEVTIRTENRYLETPVRGYDEVKQGEYVVLTVSDTGMGIPAENIGKIFEPFYTKKTMGRSGTGLGLAIVWGTVKDHSGYIDVQSEVGKGTTFMLYFPVTREELIAPLQKEPIERYMGNGESVLVIDDIAEQRDVAARLLTRLGYEAHVVSSGEEAVEYLTGNKADILVLDMIMVPGIDGLETYQRVLEINPKQKAIIVSGFSETERVREAQRLGAGAYVKKPYIMEKIGIAIRDELNR